MPPRMQSTMVISLVAQLGSMIALVALACAPVATLTPLPPPTPDRRTEYINWMQYSLLPVGSNVTDLGELFSNPLSNNDVWREEVRKRAEFLVNKRNEAATIVPPEQWEGVHKSVMGSLEVYAEGAGYSVLEALTAFEKASGKDIPFKVVERRPGDIAECYADSTRAQNELKWTPRYSLDEMCADAWRWQQRYPEGFPQGFPS